MGHPARYWEREQGARSGALLFNVRTALPSASGGQHPDTTCRGFSFIKKKPHPWTVLEGIFHQLLPLAPKGYE